MPFKDLFSAFVSGIPIKRKPWGGYWIYDARDGHITMFTKNGDITPLVQTDNQLFTIANILQDDWEVATNENCVVEIVKI